MIRPPCPEPERPLRAVPDHPGPVPEGFAHTVRHLSSPAGEIAVLRIRGEIDSRAATALLTVVVDTLGARPGHLVVDLSAVAFCGARGLRALVQGAAVAAAAGHTGYSVSGASRTARHVWARLWPAAERPDCHPDVAEAVLAAMAEPSRPGPRAAVHGDALDALGVAYGAGDLTPGLVAHLHAGLADLSSRADTAAPPRDEPGHRPGLSLVRCPRATGHGGGRS